MNNTRVRAPLQAQIVEWRVAPGERVLWMRLLGKQLLRYPNMP